MKLWWTCDAYGSWDSEEEYPGRPWGFDAAITPELWARYEAARKAFEDVTDEVWAFVKTEEKR